MTERDSDKFDDIRSNIEKSINPFITIKIDLPDNTDKEQFLELENNQDFLEQVKEFAGQYIKKNNVAHV